VRDAAVLLCYPGVQEYNTAHWAFRRLASMLARDGFHVLRFDWSGTGDSWGETTDGTIETWLGDIEAAVEEARDASGARAIALVGMRLGAAIAALACSRGLSAQTLVLWEPVVRGTDYIDELEVLDERENLRLLHHVRRARDELVGFPFSRTLRRSIAQLDLFESLPVGAKRVAIVVGQERPDFRELGDAFERAGLDSRYVYAPEVDGADGGDGAVRAVNGGRREAALLGNRCLSAIADVLVGRAQSQ
jgi:pimeloyl-ACP methyl ester carboxylesterase